jgi:ribosome assembly protein YihI (activator of Der GTPase)
VSIKVVEVNHWAKKKKKKKKKKRGGISGSQEEEEGTRFVGQALGRGTPHVRNAM